MSPISIDFLLATDKKIGKNWDRRNTLKKRFIGLSPLSPLSIIQRKRKKPPLSERHPDKRSISALSRHRDYAHRVHS